LKRLIFIHRKDAKDAEINILLIFAEAPKIKIPLPTDFSFLYGIKLTFHNHFMIIYICYCPQGMGVYLDRRLSDQDKNENPLRTLRLCGEKTQKNKY
jgi:hypothetical protein